MQTKYKKGYALEKMLVNRINKTSQWFAQRAPSSKGVDIIASSRKYYTTVFLECKNTDKEEFRIPRDEIVKLIAKADAAGAEPYVVIHWRGRKDENDKRRKRLCFYPREFLAAQLDRKRAKTIVFKPYDYHLKFEDVFER
ncbi:MAG: hypothetical protein J7K68_01495 [Candidatus Diapherotrites archaeon]|nr:hypothetical protein [Candidatus Diapherotrites archaeon]